MRQLTIDKRAENPYGTFNLPTKPRILTRRDAIDFVSQLRKTEGIHGSDERYEGSTLPLVKTFARSIAPKRRKAISPEDLSASLRCLVILTKDIYPDVSVHQQPDCPELQTVLIFPKTIGLSKTKKTLSIVGLAAAAGAAVDAGLTTLFMAYNLPPAWQTATLLGGNALAAATGVIWAFVKICSNWKNAKNASLDKIAAGLEVAIKNVLPKPGQATTSEPK